jgi:GH24 family phage-related lysozyme (muramidase)
MSIRFGEDTLIIPALGPIDIVGSCAVSEFVDLNLANWVTFLVSFGVVTTGAGATCDDVKIFVEGSSIGSSASATMIGFDYRLSSVVATQGWGAITDGTTAGTNFVTSDLTQAAVLIDVDPADVLALGEAHRWVGVHLTPTSTKAINVSVTAFLEPRYPGNSSPSSS